MKDLLAPHPEDDALLHDHDDLVDVLDAREVAVQDHEVGLVARPDRAEAIVDPEEPGRGW